MTKDVRRKARRQTAHARRLRITTYAVAATAVLGLLPGMLLLREASQDPAFTALDDLELPAWAARAPADKAEGSRWCVGRCRVRERTWTSDGGLEETAAAYADALTARDWAPRTVPGCPPTVDIVGFYGCWTRDEYILDLWVRPLPCDTEDLAARETCTGATVTAVVRNEIDDGRPEPQP